MTDRPRLAAPGVDARLEGGRHCGVWEGGRRCAAWGEGRRYGVTTTHTSDQGAVIRAPAVARHTAARRRVQVRVRVWVAAVALLAGSLDRSGCASPRSRHTPGPSRMSHRGPWGSIHVAVEEALGAGARPRRTGGRSRRAWEVARRSYRQASRWSRAAALHCSAPRRMPCRVSVHGGAWIHTASSSRAARPPASRHSGRAGLHTRRISPAPFSSCRASSRRRTCRSRRRSAPLSSGQVRQRLAR